MDTVLSLAIVYAVHWKLFFQIQQKKVTLFYTSSLSAIHYPPSFSVSILAKQQTQATDDDPPPLHVRVHPISSTIPTKNSFNFPPLLFLAPTLNIILNSPLVWYLLLLIHNRIVKKLGNQTQGSFSMFFLFYEVNVLLITNYHKFLPHINASSVFSKHLSQAKRDMLIIPFCLFLFFFFYFQLDIYAL